MNNLFLIIHMFLFYKLINCTGVNDRFHDQEFDKELKEIFFENLLNHPFLSGKTLTPTTMIFMDTQISNYLTLGPKSFNSVKHARTGRAVNKSFTLTYETGIFKFKGFLIKYSLHISLPIDVILFVHGFQQSIFAASLECNNLDCSNSPYSFNIYKLTDGNEFLRIHKIPIIGALKLKLYTFENLTYFIIIRKISDFLDNIEIWELNTVNDLRLIQILELPRTRDVISWRFSKDNYFSVATSDNSVQVYKWVGKHFDRIYHIKTENAKKIISFNIGSHRFFVILNRRYTRASREISDEIFCDIYKYDLNGDQFSLYQKLVTKSDADIKHFYYRQNNLQEHFLLVVNQYETDQNVNENLLPKTASILYKFIDNYFIPFQSFAVVDGIKEWLPIVGTRGELVLMMICMTSTRYFQYNGWQFTEVNVTNEYSISSPIIAAHSYILGNETFVVLINKSNMGSSVTVYSPKFEREHMLAEFENSLEKWCSKTLQNIDNEKLEDILQIVEVSPKMHDSDIVLKRNASFNSLSVQHLHAFEINDILGNPLDVNAIKELQLIESKMDSQISELNSRKRRDANTNAIHTFGDVVADRVFLNASTATFLKVNTEFVLDYDVHKILQNHARIDNDISLKNEVEFDHLTVLNQVDFVHVNGKRFSDLMRKDFVANIPNVQVNGKVTFASGFTVAGLVDGVNVRENSIITHLDNQILDDDFRFAEVITENLYSRFKTEKASVVNNLEFLDVNNVFVRGFVNGVDVPTLNEYALKIMGDQTVEGGYKFGTLSVEHFNTKAFVSNVKIPDDLISISRGRFAVQQDVTFLNQISTSDLLVSDRINALTVFRGKLQVLLRNSTVKQEMEGLKVFENLEMRNPIKLQGKIKSKLMDVMNPHKIVEEELNLEGDYYISGQVTVENLARADDFLNSERTGNVSIRRLFEKGLKLNEPAISQRLIFKQALNVDSVSLDTVNDVKPEMWLLANANVKQIISGWKFFQNNIHITDKSKVISINGINLENLERDLFKIVGNQTVLGTHFIQNLKADRVQSKVVKYDRKLENLLNLDGEQRITGVAICNGIVNVDKLVSENLEINRKLNGISIKSVLSDIVRTDYLSNNRSVISGKKTFQSSLSFGNLNLLRNSDAKFLKSSPYLRFLSVNEDLYLNHATVAKILVHGDNSLINGVDTENFGQNWLTQSYGSIVGDFRMETVKVMGKLIINSGEINEYTLEDIVQNSAKIFEDLGFAFGDFRSGILSVGDITLRGKLGSLNVDQLFQETFNNDSSGFTSNVIFQNLVTVEGEFFVKSFISGLNMTELCNYAFPTEDENAPHLIVNGNAYFARGPKLQSINDKDVQHILKNAWFRDRATEITGNTEFQTVVFQNHIDVHNLVNGIDLVWLKDNYFSKSRNQTIAAVFHFRDGVIFEHSVFAKNVKVAENFAGINFDEFFRSALINNYDQVFDQNFAIDSCKILDISGNYSINKYNFPKDMMRYDVSNNIIEGHKSIGNASANYLNVLKDIRIQNIYLLQFLTDAILKHGSFTDKGMKTFTNATVFNEIGLKGLMNGIYFDRRNIMFKSIPQEITGIKVFTDFMKTLVFHKFYSDEKINEIDVRTLLINQVFKDINNNAITSPLFFSKNIEANNINFVNSYDGINVTRLISDIKTNLFAYNYEKEFVWLLGNATHIGQSLLLQAYFLKNFITFQIFPRAAQVTAIDFFRTGSSSLAALIQEEDRAVIDFYSWNNTMETFSVDRSVQQMVFHGNVVILDTILLSNLAYLYVERINLAENISGAISLGRLFKRTNAVDLQLIQEIPQNNTISLTSLQLPDQKQSCLLFLYLENSLAKMFCEILPVRNGTLYLHQEILISGIPIQATSVEIGDYTFLIIAKTKESVEVWRYEIQHRVFMPFQIIPTETPIAVTSVRYRKQFYLAIASGHVKNAIYRGLIDIARFDIEKGHFEMQQQLDLKFPSKIEFVVLPTDELVLYVLTNNPSQHFMVFLYEGLIGFTAKVTESSISKYARLGTFTEKNKLHFVVLSNGYESTLVQAVFHGHSWISLKETGIAARNQDTENPE